jgi:hypothetical protein
MKDRLRNKGTILICYEYRETSTCGGKFGCETFSKDAIIYPPTEDTNE